MSYRIFDAPKEGSSAKNVLGLQLGSLFLIFSTRDWREHPFVDMLTSATGGNYPRNRDCIPR